MYLDQTGQGFNLNTVGAKYTKKDMWDMMHIANDQAKKAEDHAAYLQKK